MDTSAAVSPSLPQDFLDWISDAPDSILDSTQTEDSIFTLLGELHRERASRTGIPPLPPRPMSTEMRIVTAIREADTRCRLAEDKPLASVRQYLRHKHPGSPCMATIYDHFIAWPHALLAAQEAEHRHAATRRKKGGSRLTAKFDLAACQRALLHYSEAHGGWLPAEGEYQRWIVHHPELPSVDQIRGRTSKRYTRTWQEVVEGAMRQALSSTDWPITRQRLMLIEVGA